MGDESLQEWTTATGNAEAAALAQLADGAFYAACPTVGEAGWGIVYKDDHEEEILQADGETVKKVMVNEASTLLSVVTKSQIVVGFFDEDKQSSGNCKKVTCDFAAY